MSIAKQIKERRALGLREFGRGFVTVGAGGDFPTIQAAIASRSVAEMFVPFSASGLPVSVTSWAINDPVAYLTNFTLDSGSVQEFGGLWFQLAGETRLYPVESINSQTPDSLIARVNRIDASVSTTKAISFFLAVPLNIVLLDQFHTEKLPVSTPVSVHISSVASTVWRPDPAANDGIAMAIDTAAGYFDIRIGLGIQLVGGIQPAGTSAPTSGILEFDGCKHRSDVSDLHAIDNCGAVTFNRCDMTQHAVNALGHYCLSQGLPGDLTIRDCSMSLGGNAFGVVKLFPWDSLSVRSLIVDGLDILLDDYEGRVTQIGLFSIGTAAGKFSASGVRIKSKYPTSATVVLFDEMPSSAPNLAADVSPVELADCHFVGPNFTGTKYLYRASTGGSGRVVSVQACSGGVVDTPSVGSRTVIPLVT